MFTVIPGYSLFEVNKAGVVRRISNQKVIPHQIGMRSKRPSVKLCGDNYKVKSVDIARAILMANHPVPNPQWVSVHYKDGNILNFQYDNISWSYEWTTPTPLPDDVIWEDYFVPSLLDPSLLVSPSGLVKRSESNRFIGHIREDRNDGYIYVTGDKGVFGVHRLVAATYLKHPIDIWQLLPNHIDGDKTNNHVSNLEWSTPGENNQHAILAGLKGKISTIESMNALTGNVRSFATLNDAARFHGLTAGAIHYRIYGERPGETRPVRSSYKFGFYYRDPNLGLEWPTVEQRRVDLNTTVVAIGNGTGVWLLPRDGGDAFWVCSYRKATETLGLEVDPRQLKVYLEAYPFAVPYNDHLAVRGSRDTPPTWVNYPDPIYDVFNAHSKSMVKGTPISVCDQTTGITTYWASFKAWWYAHQKEINAANDIRWLNRPVGLVPKKVLGLYKKRWFITDIKLTDYVEQ